MIQYESFTKQYGAVAAVTDLDLEVSDGETLALIGPNGSGKTTTLKAAVGLVRPTAGRVRVAGRDAWAGGAAARAAVGYLPQRLAFPAGCSAREVVRLYARLRGAGGDEADRLLARVGLDAAADRAVDGYSGGMRQRLGLAIALLGRPRALVLDEPSAALDPTGSLTVRDLIRDIKSEGITVLLSSHDLAEVAALADRIAIFVAGRLAAIGSQPQLSEMLRLQDGWGSVEHIYRRATEPSHAGAR